MKWIILLTSSLWLTACGFSNNGVIEYQQVVVTPPLPQLTIVDVEPVDVTTTRVSYY